jgi:hypothetical protein
VGKLYVIFIELGMKRGLLSGLKGITHVKSYNFRNEQMAYSILNLRGCKGYSV